MSSLPDLSLGKDTLTGRTEDPTADLIPGVHVSGDAPTIPVATDHSKTASVPTDDAPTAPVQMTKAPEASTTSGDDHTVALPDSELNGTRMTAINRGLILARHWADHAMHEARGAAAHPGGVLAARPPSIAEYRAYVRSRAWLPDGYDRGWLLWVPLAYYNTLGTAGVAAGYAAAWLFSRLLHVLIAATVTVTAVALWLLF